MSTKGTRQRQSKACRLYLAFELALKEWKLAFSSGLADKPILRRVPAGNLEQLEQAIDQAKQKLGLGSKAAVLSCYEAGREGFWLHRYLVSVGVRNRIVDSASIEVNRRKRRAKSDRLDAIKLVSMLIRSVSGEKLLAITKKRRFLDPRRGRRAGGAGAVSDRTCDLFAGRPAV